jgi:6-phosphogluconate dehydrogenase
MIDSLKKPRRIMLMVQAGKAVDDFIDSLVIKFFNKNI